MSWDLIFQHLFIVLAASLLSIAVGLPLGIWAYVSKTARPVILRIVDLLQTIPSWRTFSNSPFFFNTTESNKVSPTFNVICAPSAKLLRQ